MVELTMALFAKFWVNGNQDELLSNTSGKIQAANSVMLP
jgi:hypothetical protein